MPRRLDNRGDVIREFWALFLDSKVGKDNQVPGFRRAWDTLGPQAQHTADLYAESCWIKIQRDHRDPDECIAFGVAALRLVLEHQGHESTPLRPRPEYVAFRKGLVERIRSEHLTPEQVGHILMDAADQFHEIERDEIERLIRAGKDWLVASGKFRDIPAVIATAEHNDYGVSERWMTGKGDRYFTPAEAAEILTRNEG